MNKICKGFFKRHNFYCEQVTEHEAGVIYLLENSRKQIQAPPHMDNYAGDWVWELSQVVLDRTCGYVASGLILFLSHQFAHVLTAFPILLDYEQPPLPGESKSFITRDLALLALFKLRGNTPPADIVEFFATAGADISDITGPVRDLEQRGVEATRLGAVAYIPIERGGEVKAALEKAEM